MLCYKDKWFCNQQDCFKFNECKGAANEERQAEAEKLGLPIQTGDEIPACFEKEKTDIEKR